MRPRPVRWAVAAMFALALAPSSARAETLDSLNLDLTGSGQSVRFRFDGYPRTIVAGTFEWQQLGTPNPAFPTALTTYCIEITNSVNDPTLFTVQPDLKLAPTIGTQQKADAITRLFDRYYADSLTSSAKEAAFQLALWELVYDGATSKNLNAGRVQGVDNQQETDAQKLLNDLNKPYSNGSLTGYSLVALVSTKYQDQIAVIKNPEGNPVPAPPGLVLGALGFGCLALRRRLRRDPAAPTA